MVTTSKFNHAMDAVLTELEVHCEVIRRPDLELDELLAIRHNLAGGCLRKLIAIAIHQKMLELQMAGN